MRINNKSVIGNLMAYMNIHDLLLRHVRDIPAVISFDLYGFSTTIPPTGLPKPPPSPISVYIIHVLLVSYADLRTNPSNPI